ncbi:MAG: replication protein, partial [Candidatus Goldbacteria bacterium]|nr:replication protein [Candidatus Goldiibacteriota bacterium]
MKTIENQTNQTPQLEDGYTRIANEIIDKLCQFRISGEEWQVLWVIIRKTYGYHKKEEKISITQFEKATGLKRASVYRAIKKLLAKKLIGISKSANSQINSYCFNKLIKEWITISKNANTPKTISKNANKTISKKATHKRYIKYNNNILSKDNIGKAYGNEEINFILSSYKKYIGFEPTDRRPRFVANSIRANIKRFIEDAKPYRQYTFNEVVEK